MPALRDRLRDRGLPGCETYLQSGNLVVRSARHRDAIALLVETALREDLGVETTAIVRSEHEWRAVLAANPFAGSSTLVQVVLLSAVPDAARVEALESEDWGDDRVAVVGDAVYVEYAGGRVHASRAQHATILRRLRVSGTARTWATVVGVARLAGLDTAAPGTA